MNRSDPGARALRPSWPTLGTLGRVFVDRIGEDFRADQRLDRVHNFWIGEQIEVTGQPVVPKLTAKFEKVGVGQAVKEPGQPVLERALWVGVAD